MPPKTRSNRRQGGSALPEPVKSNTPSSTSRSQGPPSSRARKWRTSGAVDKQSTLTQIDFIRRPEDPTFEDLDLDFENEITLLPESTTPNRKRKPLGIEISNASDVAAESMSVKKIKSQRREDDKENDVLAEPEDGFFLPVQILKTPSKNLRREIPSSQSPTTPFSIRKARRHTRSVLNSPLKDVSVNVRHVPRFVVGDTYTTDDSLSNSPSMGPKGLPNMTPGCGSEKTPTLRVSSHKIVRQIKQNSQMEIRDSDEEISDTELMKSSPMVGPIADPDDTTFTKVSIPGLDQARYCSPGLPDVDADIMKLPISDDSRDENAGFPMKGPAVVAESVQEEANTLEHTVLIKPKRRYSTRRQYSILADTSSGLSLEELPSFDSISEPMVPEGGAETAGRAIDVPRGPHLASDPDLVQVPSSQASQVEIEVQEEPDHGSDKVPSSQPSNDHEDQTGPTGTKQACIHPSAIASDSQQAIAQLQQESQWQAPIFHPSQATTASIHSSPIKEAIPKIQSSSSLSSTSNKRGWFFSPLTDSQLLPDSIMNFELPKLPAILGGKSAVIEEDKKE